MEAVDLIIKNINVVTMNDTGAEIKDGAVAIKGDRFVGVGTTELIEKAFSSKKIVDGFHKALFPGFINSHGHLFQKLLAENRI